MIRRQQTRLNLGKDHFTISRCLADIIDRFDPVLDAKSHSTVPGHSTTLTGTGTAGANYGTTDSSYGTTGSSYSTNAGPHDNNLANKMDPRVYSALDNRANPASSVPGSTDTGMTHTTGGIGTGTGTSTATGLDNTTGTGMGGTTGSGMTGSGITGGVPGSATIPGDNTGNLAPTGPAPNTAGPHANDMANKLDPVSMHSSPLRPTY